MTGAGSTSVLTVDRLKRKNLTARSDPVLGLFGDYESTNGGTVGGQVGYRWQQSNFVFAWKPKATGQT